MVWSEETILLLKELWTLGHSTAEIGRRLSVTKNAIVGKAHRLDLTARPSPIRRDASASISERPQPSTRVEGTTLPPLVSASSHPVVSNIQTIRAATAALGIIPANKSFTAPISAAPACVAPLPDAAPVRAAAASPPLRQRRSAPSCCWPIGEPGKRDFRFCDDPSIPGKPYCDNHAKLAYVKIRDRKEDAA